MALIAATLAPGVAVAAPACGSSLQARINAASAGSVLDLTGCTYTAGATVTKPLTLRGAVIRPAAGTAGLSVSADDVTLDGLTILGKQATTFNQSEMGVVVSGTAAAPIRRLTIRNCEIGTFGYGGMLLRQVTELLVEDNHVHDGVYAGIMVLSGRDSRIEGNTVQRIGVVGSEANGGNAYGIALSQVTGQAPSTDIVIARNTVEDVPTWHALDTHAGQRLSFIDNIVRRASRALFLTSGPVDILVEGNQFLSPAPVTFNLQAITIVSAQGVTFRDNIKTGWGNSPLWYDYGGGSTGIVNAGGNAVKR